MRTDPSRRIVLWLTALCAISASSVLPLHADPPPPSPTGTTADPYRIVPNTGWWWSTSESGRGYSVEVDPSTGKAFFAAYLYSDAGPSLWYVATLTAQLSNVVGSGFYGPYTITTDYTGTLTAYSGGQSLGGAYTSPSSAPVGSITVTFSSPKVGTITWPAGTQSTPSSIVRYPINGTSVQSAASGIVPQAGWWYNASAGGTGYFIEVQGSTAFIATYMYRAADKSSVWYATQNAMTDVSHYSGTLSEYGNGPTLANPSRTTSAVVASPSSVVMSFSSPTQGTVQFGAAAPISITRFTLF